MNKGKDLLLSVLLLDDFSKTKTAAFVIFGSAIDNYRT
jgi:hypothetical protein